MEANHIPLPERLRPKSLEQVQGQSVAVNALRKWLDSGLLPSLIFYGPPGTGKTTLARVLALETGRPFDAINAVSSGVKDIRDLIEKARKSSLFEYQAKPLVFIDEIHRFNKSQQDGLLAAVEQGLFTLIGATTENPSFEVNSALLSRCQVLTLQPLSTQELNEVLQRALLEDAWLQERKVELLQAEALIQAGGGDARRMLNALEMAVNYAFDGEKARIDGAVLAAALHACCGSVAVQSWKSSNSALMRSMASFCKTAASVSCTGGLTAVPVRAMRMGWAILPMPTPVRSR